MRPIDIARRLGISTAALRNYERLGLLPDISRTPFGYRVYTEEHVAYFACIREMTDGFTQTRIAAFLDAVKAQKIDDALWMATKAQAALYREKSISKNIILQLLHKAVKPISKTGELLTVSELSRETDIPMTTLRYWDTIGLLTAQRADGNQYRLFTSEQVRKALVLYALKLSFQARGEKHYISKVRDALSQFDPGDKSKIKELVNSITRYLDQTNKSQIKGIAALHRLCVQAETNCFDYLCSK